MMNNCFFVILIWGAIYFFSCIDSELGDNYDYLSPYFVKILGNPLSINKDIKLSTGIIRICNNALLLGSFIVRFLLPNSKDYWKYSGAINIISIFLLSCISIIIEQVFVCTRKKRQGHNMKGNVALICIFVFWTIALSYAFFKMSLSR